MAQTPARTPEGTGELSDIDLVESWLDDPDYDEDEDLGEDLDEQDPDDEEDDEAPGDEDVEDESDESDPEAVAGELDLSKLQVTLKDGELTEVVGYEDLVKRAHMGLNYTRRSQELSERARQVAVVESEVQQERARYSAILDALEDQARVLPVPAPDPSLLDTAPAEYLRQKTRHEEYVGRLQAIRAERETLSLKEARERERKLMEISREEGKRLLEVVPEWRDPKTRDRERIEVIEFAIERGFHPEEVTELTDHRAVAVLRDAMLYRRLKSKGKEVIEGKGPRKRQEQSRDEPRVATPGTRKPLDQGLSKARKRLAQEGTDAAAMDYLMRLL